MKRKCIISEEKKELYRNIQKKLHVYKFENKAKPTLAEKKFYRLLKVNGVKFQSQRMFYNESLQCITDFFIKSDGLNIVIEIDGGYHLSEYQTKKDQYRSEWLMENRKCKIIRFTNEDIINTPDICLRLLSELYLKSCKRSLSKNHKTFSRILGVPEYSKNNIPPPTFTNNWGNEEPLF